MNSYSLTGSDASSFSISVSGTITFSSAPDYEVAGDANGDNVYEMSVVVSDGNLSASLGLVITVNNDTSDDAAQGPLLLETKVIDGYISGANVFIDFNWNLSQDDGEPSATEDSTNQVYNFEETDFASINNFTVDCAKLCTVNGKIIDGCEICFFKVIDLIGRVFGGTWFAVVL